MAGQAAPVFSIGHSNHEWDVFLALLQQHGIEVLADVRSAPYSRFVPVYNQDNLKQALSQASIDYLFLGKELGGRPKDDDFYDADGHVLYSRVAQSTSFLEGIARLDKGAAKYRIALMCSEENPLVCHRHLLVGRVLHERAVNYLHIRADGQLQAEANLRHKEVQPMLFQDLADLEWRSLKSMKDRSRFQDEEP